MKKETYHLAPCNHCNRKKCKIVGQVDPCKLWIDPWGKFKMAELLLAHPQSLHNALSALPFKTDLTFKL